MSQKYVVRANDDLTVELLRNPRHGGTIRGSSLHALKNWDNGQDVLKRTTGFLHVTLTMRTYLGTAWPRLGEEKKYHPTEVSLREEPPRIPRKASPPPAFLAPK